MCQCLHAADEATGCSPLAALAARAASGELAALQAQPHALSLCLPGFTNILSSTLTHLTKPFSISTAGGHLPTATSDTAAPVKGHSAVVQHWCSVARVLLDMLSKAQIEHQLRSLLVRPFTAQHSSAAAAICVALLQLMPSMFDKLGLEVYLTHLHPHVMHMTVTSANQAQTPGSAASQSTTSSQIAASFERAQMTNAASTALCGVAGNKLTLPVVLEHVIRPLLLALGNSPDVAVALIGVGGAIGGPMTALHVLPCLIMVLISSSVSETAGGSAQQRAPARQRLSESEPHDSSTAAGTDPDALVLAGSCNVSAMYTLLRLHLHGPHLYYNLTGEAVSCCPDPANRACKCAKLSD